MNCSRGLRGACRNTAGRPAMQSSQCHSPCSHVIIVMCRKHLLRCQVSARSHRVDADKRQLRCHGLQAWLSDVSATAFHFSAMACTGAVCTADIFALRATEP